MLRTSSLLLVLALTACNKWSMVFSQDNQPQASLPSDAAKDQKIQARDELWQQAQALQSAGKAAEALTAGERVLSLERELYGNTHAELTGTMEWLSQQYLAQQNLPQAETYAVELQRVQEALHGKAGWQAVSARWRLDHVRKLSTVAPATLTRMLAIEAEFIRLFAKGKQADAAAEIEKLIPLEEAALGPDHPFFANCFAHQADFLLTAEQFAASETAALRALSIRRKQLGDQHPDTAFAAYLLARSLIGQDRHSEAVHRLELARDAWLASRHFVDAAWMDSWRGDSLVRLKRPDEAKAAYQAALAVFREQKEAEGEAQQLKRLSDLADVYVDLAAWSEAESLRHELLQQETARLGENHWQVTDARLALENVRRNASLTTEQREQLRLAQQLASDVHRKESTGNYGEAIQLTERVLDIVKAIMSDRHPEYARSLNRLAALYDSMAEYARAEPLYLQTLEIRKSVLGDRHPDYATSLNNLAFLYASMGDAAKAEPLYVQALEIRKSVLGDRHPDYATSLNNLAFLYASKGDAAKAEPLYVQALELRKAVLGDRHPDYASSLNNLAFLYKTMADYAKAETLYVQALEIRKSVLGDRHPDYATSLNNLAFLYASKGDAAKAEPLYVQALELRKAVLGEQHADYATSLDNLADLYRSMADYARAETLYEQALEIRKSVLGDRHPDYAASLNNLGTLYFSKGDAAKAEPLFVQALEITKAVRGDLHLDYATSLSNLAVLYESMGDSAKAEPLYLQALEIRKAELGDRHPDYATSLDNLGSLYSSMGGALKAEPLYEQALEIRKSVLGDRHPDYATSLNNLAFLYASKGDAAKAEPLYVQALELRKAVLGDRDPDYALSLNNLALLYQSKGDAAKAEPLLVQALEIRKSVLGDRHPDYASSLNNLGMLYSSKGDAAKAEPLLVQALEIRKAVLGDRHPDYASSLNNLGMLYSSKGDAAKAEPLLVQALEIRKAVLGDRHPDYATSLNNLAGLYDSMADYARAEPLYLQALEIRKSVLGDRHPDYAASLNNLGMLYSSMGDSAKAEPLHVQALALHKAVLGEQHPDYALSLNNLAFLYEKMADYARAEPLYVQALELRKSVLGDLHPDYASSLNNLALLYQSKGDSAKAEPLLVQALELRKSVLGDRHPDYATSLNNLGMLYGSMGDYAKAEPLLVQATEIFKAILGQRHPDYATSLSNLAMLYESMGDGAKAEPLCVQALEIRKSVLGERHPAYASSLNNLAALYESMGDYAKAEPLLVQATEIFKAIPGERHPAYASSLNNLAALYVSMADYVKAEPLHVQALEIRKSVFGDRHPDYAISLNNLAGLYVSMGEHARAEPRYVQATEIFKAILGDRHPAYASSLNNLAGMYRRMGDLAKAEPLHVQSLGISRDILERAALMQSERQQLAMGQMLRHHLDSYVSFTLEAAQFQASAAREVLRWKGATLVRQRAMRLAAEDPAIADRFRALQQVSRRLASLSRATPAGDLDNWKTQITDLTGEKERLEAQLSRDSSAFRSAMEEITPQQIQAAVPRDAVLIDYLQFTRSRPAAKKGSWDSTTSLLAVIVKHDGESQMVELGAVAKLNGAIDTWRETFGMSPQGQQAGLQIRRQIWEPLLPHIGDATTILVSVDGVLGRLPLGALPGKAAGTYLIEDHRLAMIPVPQLLPALVSDLGRRDLSRELLLLGDVDYDSEPAKPDEDAPKKRKRRRPGESRGDTVGSEFRPLPGSADEVDLIEKLYVDLFETEAADIQSLNQSTASESAFREFAGQFRHLHLATHGFFSPATVQSALSPEAIREGAQRRLAVETPAASSVSVPRITGIGATLAVVTDGAVVEQLVPDGPAARHGKLKTGDVIIGVGEGESEIVSVAGMLLEQIVQRIRGQEGSTVRLQIKPADSEELQVYSLVRAVVPGTAGVPATSNTAPQMDPGDVQVTGFNPDLLSGLALAGANLQPEPGRDDGILTAQEIAFLPLNGVDTVVLSACETGLGNTAGGEGLISVQRAFQISGARTTLASFWKVNDVVTQRLMVRFYRNLWEKDMSRLDALREAQLYVLNNPDAIRGASLEPNDQTQPRVSPVFWAAFTLSGDWR